DGGRRIHIEDFAQIFGVFPERKYEGVSCRNICAVINNEARQQDSEEFIRRLVFCAMIGNGDMHLKNWSLIYPDGKNPQLAPAYDLVSTIVYIRQDTMALSVAGSKSFEDFNPQLLLRLAAAAGLAQAAVKNVAAATVEATASNWTAIAAQSSLPAGDRKIIGQHISRIASKFTSWL
ncbi:MAG: HipA domain-containing protein, partial [Betaproteobacteria bacterium]|nr:HipA domain-containing protein [Betaproteobacteria bacterium]